MKYVTMYSFSSLHLFCTALSILARGKMMQMGEVLVKPVICTFFTYAQNKKKRKKKTLVGFAMYNTKRLLRLLTSKIATNLLQTNRI